MSGSDMGYGNLGNGDMAWMLVAWEEKKETNKRESARVWEKKGVRY